MLPANVALGDTGRIVLALEGPATIGWRGCATLGGVTTARVLLLVAMATAAGVGAPEADDAPTPPAASEGTLGDCTIALTGGAYWRSAILGGPQGASPDGFGPMTVRVDAHVECSTDTSLRVARAWAVLGTQRHALRSPDRWISEGMTEWDGRVAAGTPIDLAFIWQGGPFAPGRAGGNAHAIVRFAVGRATLELEAPPRAVAFPS
jgi:hypothetical protein